MAELLMNVSHTSARKLVVDVDVKTDAFPGTTNTAYHEGDLLKIDASTNKLVHSTDGKDWSVICAKNYTAAESTNIAAKGIDTSVYISGKFNIAAVKINGQSLTEQQKLDARAHALANTSCKLIKVVGDK